ncbi:hypothetical protein DFH29DRAFT_999831 [Suillus ampliporus]|nr:hypothetical protein DFH29DRAFT_999831 [Suillus ampliporus]
MANSVIIPSQAIWQGEITIAGIRTEGEFKVFDSGGRWKFLFGKPLLHAFKAVHNYETDHVQITGKGGSTTIRNQGLTENPTVEEVSAEHDTETANVQTQKDNNDQVPHADPALKTEIPICVLTEDGMLPEESLAGVLNQIPIDFLENEAAIFTRLTDPFKADQVAFMVKKVQYGKDLTEDERWQAETLMASFVDIFVGSLSEVLPVPGAKHTLNIPDGTTFHLRVHQQALTPPQLQFLHGKIDEMLTAGIIEHAPPDLIKCAATTVLAKKAHEQGGLSLEEL